MHRTRCLPHLRQPQRLPEQLLADKLLATRLEQLVEIACRALPQSSARGFSPEKGAWDHARDLAPILEAFSKQLRRRTLSLQKSLQVARETLAAHDLAEAIHLEEGSGISRGNRFTARTSACRIVNIALKDAMILPYDANPAGWNFRKGQGGDAPVNSGRLSTGNRQPAIGIPLSLCDGKQSGFDIRPMSQKCQKRHSILPLLDGNTPF